MPTVLDGKYVELWNVPSWRRKLGIGESFPTVFERIETIVSGGISSISSASERLAAFATLEEAGYVVQTSTAPPTFAGRQIRGVPNRINVTFGTGIPGDTIIQTPQDIHAGATPSFRTIKPTALDREFVTYVNGVGELASTTVTADELTTLATAVGLTGVLQGNGPGNPITAALGTPNYIPKWSATDPYLTATSALFDDGAGHVGVHTALPGAGLHVDSPANPVARFERIGTFTTELQTAGTNVLFGPTQAGVTFGIQVENIERVRIDTVGVGIHTTTPTHPLTFPLGSQGIALHNAADMVVNYVRGQFGPWSGSNLIVGSVAASTALASNLYFVATGAGSQSSFRFSRLATGVNSDAHMELLLQSTLASGNVLLIRFRPSGAVTGGGKGGLWATDGAWSPTSGSGANWAHFIVANSINSTGTVSTARYSSLRVSTFLQSLTGITTGPYLADFGTSSGASHSGTHTPMFLVDTSGNTHLAGALVIGSADVAVVPAAANTVLPGTDSAWDIGSPLAAGNKFRRIFLKYNIASSPTLVDMYNLDTTAGISHGLGVSASFARTGSATSIPAAFISIDKEQEWTSTATTQDAKLTIQLAVDGTLTTRGTLSSAGLWETQIMNAVVGFRQGGLGTLGEFLVGDGTNIVLTAVSASSFPHTILDASVHTDSVTQTVTRGSLIYGNATPKWDELVIGAANRVLRSDGTDPSWAQVNLTTDVTGTLPVGNGGTGTTAFVGDAIVYTSPAGTALQADADLTFDVTNTQVTLSGGALGAAGSELTGFKLINPTFATAGNQKWTPTIVMSGQGWSTDAGGLTKTVEFMQYVATVQGTAAPTGYWVLERDIDNSGTFVELLRADSTGFFRITKDGLGSIDTTLAQSLFGLQMHNGTAATAGTTTQDAPTVMFKGAAWNSSASSSQDWRWRMIMKGVTVAGTTRSYLRIDSGLNASNFGNPLVISSNGGISVGALIEAAFGVCSVQVGYQIVGAAASGNFLRGNGTNFVSSAIQAGDISAAAMAHDMLSATHTDTLAAAVSRGSLIVGNATPKWSELNIGAANRLLRSDGTDASWAQAVLTTDVTGILPLANGGTNTSFNNPDAVGYVNAAGTAMVLNDGDFTFVSAVRQLSIKHDVDADFTPLHLRNSSDSNDTTGTIQVIAVLVGTDAVGTNAFQISVYKEQAWTGVAGTRDSSVEFGTCLDNIIGTALRAHSSGSVICGKNSTDAARTDDWLYICSSAGAPSTTPITEFGSRAAVGYDSTNKKIVVYDPTDDTWRSVAVA